MHAGLLAVACKWIGSYGLAVEKLAQVMKIDAHAISDLVVHGVNGRVMRDCMG